MGGCKCSYRNCKIRSDGGQTHMFHFPVFDRVRCHQWIKNAGKPNFLNLKLSQLKNRVICQHHFTDDKFMNYMKDKLKIDAVPTEIGPFCTLDDTETDLLKETDKPAMIINADDIENEKVGSVEKKAHSSVTYSDFLISDATDLFNASIDSQATLKKVSSKKLGFPTLENKFTNNRDGLKYTINYINEDNIIHKPFPNKNIPTARLVAIEIDDSPNVGKTMEATNTIELMKCNSTPTNLSKFNPNKLVKIISEKTISEPVLVEGKLKPISPSMIIQNRNKRNITYDQGNWDVKTSVESYERNKTLVAENTAQNQENMIFEQTVPCEFDPLHIDKVDLISINPLNEQENLVQYDPLHAINLNTIEGNEKQNEIDGLLQPPIDFIIKNENNEKQNDSNVLIEEPNEILMQNRPKSLTKRTVNPVNTSNGATSYKSLLKNKITPEKLAAIEEKRKFNLKMRDVITSCLDNLDESNDDIVKRIAEEKKKTEMRSILKPPEAPASNQNSIISYLENRLAKLENTLLNKIEHNTNRISELKRTMKPLGNKKNANTQTYINHMCEESQKQYLYKEISKFLSPDANITVYQELFTNKQEEEHEKPTPRKLRRRR